MSTRHRAPAPRSFPRVRPYRVTFTSKGRHVETRRYPTGRTETAGTG